MEYDVNLLRAFIAPLTSQCQEVYDWPSARFEVNTYLHAQLPPMPFITSARAVVLRKGVGASKQVLVVQDPDGYHILPGGRREEDESLIETAAREVLEETGWRATIGKLLGFKHFYRLTPKPPQVRYEHPDFAQLVYVANAKEYQPEAREVDGYELDALFVPLDQLGRYNITKGERLFLEAALT